MIWIGRLLERELARLAPHQAALVIRAAIEQRAPRVRCRGCGATYDARGDISTLDRTPFPACGSRLELES